MFNNDLTSLNSKSEHSFHIHISCPTKLFLIRNIALDGRQKGLAFEDQFSITIKLAVGAVPILTLVVSVVIIVSKLHLIAIYLDFGLSKI
jgi:hypothetical protein